MSLFYQNEHHFTDYRNPNVGPVTFTSLAAATTDAQRHLRMLPHVRCVVIRDFRGQHLRVVDRAHLQGV